VYLTTIEAILDLTYLLYIVLIRWIMVSFMLSEESI
jgi:hypothetical protein